MDEPPAAEPQVWPWPRLHRTWYISVTTFRRDGRGVPTPVWFVAEANRLYVYTAVTSGKVKRMRRDPHVTVAPCSVRGRVRATPVAGVATFLDDAEARRVARLFDHKYGITRRLLGLYGRIRRRLGQPAAPPNVYLAIVRAG